ncbi:hypothetical protein BDR26DRAFT_936908 [Obelidium mucronatum]|nr:hypothetical protein BDR26DRAFT_936908 [Obelidium mucronatum]
MVIFVVVWLTLLAKLVHPQSIVAGGSSFSAPAFASAIKEFNDLYGKSLKSISYTASDSTSGQKGVYSGAFAFGGSDVPINIAQPNGTRLIALPAIAGGLINSYNLPGVNETVRLSRVVLPRIYDGTITQWNDPALLKENPFLANINKPITVVVRSSGSGASQNLVHALGLMDISTGFEKSPYLVKGFKLSLKNAITAATTASASIIVGSVAYTFTYLNQLEAKDLELNSLSAQTTALIQHINGEYISWSSYSGLHAIANINVSAVYNLDEATSALSVIDTSAVGAYPWTIISNIVINPSNISTDDTVSLWTLRLLWFLISHPEHSTANGFIPIFNTSIGNHALISLANIEVRGKQLYGKSVCDPDIDLTYKNPCVRGYCKNLYAFQESDVECLCEFGYENIQLRTCSERSPFFIPGAITKAQLALFGTGTVLLVALIVMVFLNRGQPAIKAMSPLCCINILAGCLLGIFAIIAEAATETISVCYTKIIIPAIAFCGG